ncbi:MAG: hypothetical protein JO363_01020 [Solirubrobacterales bacterium]|nr:hypothetical protein [Solirubrobacterales bacterium]
MRLSVKRRQLPLPSVVVATILAGFVLAMILAGCGGGSSTTSAPASKQTDPSPQQHKSHPRVVIPLAAATAGQLPAGVQWPATAAVGGRVLLMGGLDQATASVDDIISASPGSIQRVGTLPYVVHDAAGASLRGQAYLFGGGEPSFSDILAVDPTGHATVAGHIPAAASDVAAAVIGGTVYVVGGYTGTVPLDTIVAWSGSGTGRVVGHLPHPVRYAAVAAINNRLIIAGGTSGDVATREVYSFDPATGNVRQIGLLARELTHAAGATLDGRVYVIGGRGGLQGTQTNAILSVDPTTGRVRPAGRLPVGLSDVGAAAIAGGVMVAGGRESSGELSHQVYMLRPRTGAP